MNENEIYVVKEYKFDNPLSPKIDCLIDDACRDCHINFFRKIKYKCIYNNELTDMTNIEIFNLTFIGNSKILYDLNKELEATKDDGLIFNQINKLTIYFYSHLRFINISYYLNFPMLMCHRQFFRTISQNRECI